ncbi:MAG TPA: hypothetical protein VFX96_00845 [Pyrinomonadaceae bacterium]|nr:hypothetical protein [Pyrinomonadaceae bacterium]
MPRVVVTPREGGREGVSATYDIAPRIANVGDARRDVFILTRT